MLLQSPLIVCALQAPSMCFLGFTTVTSRLGVYTRWCSAVRPNPPPPRRVDHIMADMFCFFSLRIPAIPSLLFAFARAVSSLLPPLYPLLGKTRGRAHICNTQNYTRADAAMRYMHYPQKERLFDS